MPTKDLMTEKLQAVYARAYRNKAFLDGILDENIRDKTLVEAGINLSSDEKAALKSQLDTTELISGKQALYMAHMLISASAGGPGTPPPPPPPPPWEPFKDIQQRKS
jgi:hypothetical protein